MSDVTTDWAGPARFLPQTEPVRREDGALTTAGVDSSVVPVEGAQHVFDGCAALDAVIQHSVDHLAKALLP